MFFLSVVFISVVSFVSWPAPTAVYMFVCVLMYVCVPVYFLCPISWGLGVYKERSPQRCVKVCIAGKMKRRESRLGVRGESDVIFSF